MRSKINTSFKQKIWHKKWVFIFIVVVAIAALGIVLANNRTTHSKQVAVHIPSKGPAAKKPAKTTAKTAVNSSNNAPVSDKSPGSSTILTAPSGTFVSNHRPSLSGSSLLRQEKSVCNTTPGASCYILFMKDGVAKQLDPQTADSTGSTYWTWDVGQAGLTQGSWKITAIATLNGQTLSANDSLELEVQP